MDLLFETDISTATLPPMAMEEGGVCVVLKSTCTVVGFKSSLNERELLDRQGNIMRKDGNYAYDDFHTLTKAGCLF